MKNISTFRLALWSGVFAEIAACVLFVVCLGYGSATPGPVAGSIVSFIYLFHLPVFWLAGLLPRMISGTFFLPLVILGGMVSFATLIWAGILLWRRLRARPPAARWRAG